MQPQEPGDLLAFIYLFLYFFCMTAEKEIQEMQEVTENKLAGWSQAPWAVFVCIFPGALVHPHGTP